MSSKKTEKRLGIDPLGMLMGIGTDKEVADDNQGNEDKLDNSVNQDKPAILDKSGNQGNIVNHGKQLKQGKHSNSGKSVNPVGSVLSVNQELSVKSSNLLPKEEEPLLSTRKGVTPGYERHTYVVRQDLADLVEAKAWWDRKDIKQVMEDALVQYFADLSVKPIPDSARKQRVPRPRNNK